MKKLYTLVLMSFCFSIFGQGQPLKGNLTKIKLTGMVVDQETKQPLEYATISLRNPKNPSRLQGGITEAEGKFNIEVFPGTYEISIEYIGFESFTKTGVIIRNNLDCFYRSCRYGLDQYIYSIKI